MSYAESLPDWLENAVAALARNDINGWMSMYADDAVHEFPLAPLGAPRSLEGREAIAAYMLKLPNLIRFGSLCDVRVHVAGSDVIIEATGRHNRANDDAEVTINYVWIIDRREALVHCFRDYMNPLQLVTLIAD